MDEQARLRLNEILADINAGTSPITRQEAFEVFTMGQFPLDAPSVEHRPLARFLQEHIDEEKGVRAYALSWDVILSTLEERLKRKKEGRP